MGWSVLKIMTEELEPLETIAQGKVDIPEQPNIKVEMELDDADSLPTDEYDYDRTMVTLTLTLFPIDGHDEGRMIGVSVRSGKETPLIAPPMRQLQVELPEVLKQMLEQYRGQLPRREEEYKKQVEQVKVEQAQREQEKVAKKAGKTSKSVDARPEAVKGRRKRVVDDSRNIESKGLFD